MSTPSPSPAPSAPVPAPAAAATQAIAEATTAKATAKMTIQKNVAAGTTETTAKPKKKTRRKKPSSSSRGTTSATSAQNIWNAAAVAQKELAQQSAHVAALRSDPLWYTTDDPLQSVAKDSFMMTGGLEVLPDQVELVEAALSNNNMNRADVTPQAFACLLEQARRFALELLADAQDYAYSANRHDITRADLVLAQELRADQPMAAFTQQPKLMQLAQQVNRTPLPPIPTKCYTGVVLPPKEHQLTARTFDVISGAQVAQRMVAAPPAPPVSKAAAETPKTSYGASRGRQIPINISQSTKGAAASSGQTSRPAPTPTTMTAAPSAVAPSTPNATMAGRGMAAQSGDAGTKRKADQM